MQEIKRFQEISFQIWDLSEPRPGQEIQLGFYFTFPIDEADKIHPAEVCLAGPYPTRDEAVSAAQDFIRECLTDHNEETDPQ